MEELYDRVLTHVPAQQLHQGYNGVLEEEFVATATAVDDVVIAFAKLEQVRDAVARLEQGHESTGGRSTSLMAVMANMMMLHREVVRITGQLATGMVVQKFPVKKRKREEAVDGEEQSSSKAQADIELVESDGQTKKSKVRDSSIKSSAELTRSGNKYNKSAADSMSEIVSVSSSESSDSSDSDDEGESNNDEGDVEAALKALMTNGVEKSADQSTCTTRDDANCVTMDIDMHTNSIKALVSRSAGKNAAVSDQTKTQDDTNGMAKAKDISTARENSKAAGAQYATCLATIVGDLHKLLPWDRVFIIPDVILALKEMVGDPAQASEVVSSLNTLVRCWPQDYEVQKEHLDLFRDYFVALQANACRLAASKHKTSITRLIGSLTKKKIHDANFRSKRKSSRIAQKPKQKATVETFAHLVASWDNSSLPHRHHHKFLWLLVAFKRETVANVDDAHGKRIFTPMNKVFRWICQKKLQEPYPMQICRMLVRAAQQATDRISGNADFAGLLDKMSEFFRDPSSGKTRQLLADIRQQAVIVYEELSSHRDSAPESKVLELVNMVRALVNHTTYGWDPRKNVATRKCVKELKRIVMKSQRRGVACKLPHCGARRAATCRDTARPSAGGSEACVARRACVQRDVQRAFSGSDASPDVSKALTQVVTACDGIGTLICELNHEISSSGTSDVSTEDEDDQKLRAEPKQEVMPVEKKKAAKDIIISPKIEENQAPDCKKSNNSIAIIDLSLSDEEKEPPVKEEKKETVPDPPAVATFPVDKNPREAAEPFDFGVAPVEEDSNQVEVGPLVDEREQEVPARKRPRKRKAPSRIAPPATKRPVKDVVIRLQKRAEMAPSGAVGVAVCSALNAAVAVENLETTGVNPHLRDFVSSTAEAAKMLVGVHKQHPVQCERHLEDMRLLMSVAIVNLENGMSADVAKKAWVMLKTLQKLHKLYPVKTKGLHRNCQQLYKTLVKDYEVPADEVKSFKSKLAKLFMEVDEYLLDDPETQWFDNRLILVNELVDGRFEGWNPRIEPILGKTVSKLERISTFGLNDKWNDRYAAICLACSKMSRMAFSFRSNLASEHTNCIIRTILEPGFEDSGRVEKDFKHVTSYDVEVQYASDLSAKKETFDELIDRLRWILNAVAMTTNQSLVPLDHLKRVNECFRILIRLCDYGNTLNLEQCLHLEKLLIVLRQVIYIRKDYASVSKQAVESLIGMFPENKRPKFVFPDRSQG